jgi:hypothetical protein
MMPEIARFFGIIIRMYVEPSAPHHRPHFHAYYQDAVAIYSVDTIELIAGALPRRQHRLVEAWADCTNPNYRRTGSVYRLGEHRSKSIH